MARKMRRVTECSFKQLYTFRNMHYQEIVEGTIDFPWALFLLLDHPKFTMETERQRAADLRKVYKQMNQKYLQELFIDISEDEE